MLLSHEQRFLGCIEHAIDSIDTVRLGGYQVFKKWLSYRERAILERAPKPEDMQHFANSGQRVFGKLGTPGDRMTNK